MPSVHDFRSLRSAAALALLPLVAACAGGSAPADVAPSPVPDHGAVAPAAEVDAGWTVTPETSAPALEHLPEARTHGDRASGMQCGKRAKMASAGTGHQGSGHSCCRGARPADSAGGGSASPHAAGGCRCHAMHGEGKVSSGPTEGSGAEGKTVMHGNKGEAGMCGRCGRHATGQTAGHAAGKAGAGERGSCKMHGAGHGSGAHGGTTGGSGHGGG